MQRSGKGREPAYMVWAGLALYILIIDMYLLLTGRKTMTEVFQEALLSPNRKWILILAWGFTTKHLFFGRFVPWLDPFGLMAGGAMVIKKTTGYRKTVYIGDANGIQCGVSEPVGIDSAAISGGRRNKKGDRLIG